MPVFPRRATKALFLPRRWRGGPTARATPPAIRPRRLDRRAGEIREREDSPWREGDGAWTRCPARGPVPARLRRCSSSSPNTWRAFLGHTEHETDLGLFSGSEARSRKTPNCSRCHLVLKKSVRLLYTSILSTDIVRSRAVTFQMFTKISSISQDILPIIRSFSILRW